MAKNWYKQIVLAAALLLRALPADPQQVHNGAGAPDSIRMDDSWRLWLDVNADWQNDPLFLPDEVDLKKLPVNPPTGGWKVLSYNAGITVTLPGTVEEHYWGQKPLPLPGSRPEEVVSISSSYKGVSWWFRSFQAPILKHGEHLIFSFPGARLRAEVYVNGKLIGYNMVDEIPFTADATTAINPKGSNQLAVRITNPGGTFNWNDYGLQGWGQYRFPVSKAFGGLDGGVTMSVRSPVWVDDLFIANHADPHTVTLNVHVTSQGEAFRGSLELSIVHDGQEVWRGSVLVNVRAKGDTVVSKDVTIADADLWDVNHPSIYTAVAAIPSIPHSTRITDFGFRWFNAVDIGSNAHLVMNGRRIFVSSAISWGYWAPNGLFPDRAAVQREIDAVQALGMNAVQNHRHFPKAAVLDGFDHAGLLRYCEAGGGSAIWDETMRGDPPAGPIDPSGFGGEPTSFANRYEFAKLLAMVKAYRSHPSVVMWSINNETASSSHNPKMFYAMRKVHDLDPSRIVILKSGFVPEGEIMARPYSPELFYGESSTGHDSGWHDIHNEDSAGVYQDNLYTDPESFKSYSADTKGIAMWGELGTANSPDDDAATVRWYLTHRVDGYNRAAAAARLNAYESFLDKYKFRSAFPTAESLFRSVGQRHYFAASHLVENARIANANDYIALSGWESTTVDNHSGLVDALRDLKSDPALLKQANSSSLIVLRPHHYVVEPDETAIVDAFLINEVNIHGPYTLHVSAAFDADRDRPFFSQDFTVSAKGGETFGELLKSGISFKAPAPGPITMSAYITSPSHPEPLLQRTEPLLIVSPNPTPIQRLIAVADYDGNFAEAIRRKLGAPVVALNSAPSPVDRIIIDSSNAPRSTWPIDEVSLPHIENTNEPELYERQWLGQPGDVGRFSGFAAGNLSVELLFADGSSTRPGERVFDIALNGRVVAKDFDIFAEAGGRERALVKTFKVVAPDGNLLLSVPTSAKGRPMIAAIRITDARGTVERFVFRRDAVKDAKGQIWRSMKDGSLIGFDWAGVLPQALDRVRKGARLILVGADASELGEAMIFLAHNNVLSFGGTAGADNTAWIGHWYFGKKHWLLDGLPSDCVFDWQYQAGAGGDGLILDAPGIEAVVGYGKNPGPNLGLGAVVIPYGQGEIVVLGISGLTAAFTGNAPNSFQPIVATRILYNALH